MNDEDEAPPENDDEMRRIDARLAEVKERWARWGHLMARHVAERMRYDEALTEVAE